VRNVCRRCSLVPHRLGDGVTTLVRQVCKQARGIAL
jgi:hypothetical protein